MCVKPLPMMIVTQVCVLAHHQEDIHPVFAIAAAKSLVLGVYFLFHPMEYYLGPPTATRTS